MKPKNHQFTNYPAFHANFEDVYIYKFEKLYYVFRESHEKFEHDYIMFGTKDNINGWLYGCVQAKNKFVTAREEILL